MAKNRTEFYANALHRRNTVWSMNLAKLEELDKYRNRSIKTQENLHLMKKDCVPELRDIP